MRRLLQWIFGVVLVLAILAVLAPLSAYKTISDRNTDRTHFDALIVLGHPAQKDGSPDPEMRERVEESVREYRAGVAPRIIMSGAAAHNHFVEADVMAALAVREGVPQDAVLVEPQAKDTIQNIWYSRRIMQQHGWTSAEVISSAYHLPRTALILKHYQSGPLLFYWKTHASNWPPEYGRTKRLEYVTYEALGTLKLRLYGFGPHLFLPGS